MISYTALPRSPPRLRSSHIIPRTSKPGQVEILAPVVQVGGHANRSDLLGVIGRTGKSHDIGYSRSIGIERSAAGRESRLAVYPVDPSSVELT